MLKNVKYIDIYPVNAVLLLYRKSNILILNMSQIKYGNNKEKHMKLILTFDEAVDLVAGLDYRAMCSRSGCYMGYKSDMCEKMTEDGKYRCKFRQNLENISKKVCAEIHKDKRHKDDYCPVCGKKIDEPAENVNE